MIYLVKIKVQPYDKESGHIGYKPLVWNGSFVPKGKKANKETIEKKVSEFLLPRLQNTEPSLGFRVEWCKITPYKNEFTVNDND